MSSPDVTTPTDDLVVLLDDDEQPIGTAPRRDVHTTTTPLHLAFSCHLHDDRGRTLVTRRALTKRTWPGVWTNSFCGHPRPGETFEQAVRRHARHELGLDVHAIEPLLPDFRYHAVDAAGIVENEVCPVFSARTDGPVVPNPRRGRRAPLGGRRRAGRAGRPRTLGAQPVARRPAAGAAAVAGRRRGLSGAGCGTPGPDVETAQLSEL